MELERIVSDTVLILLFMEIHMGPNLPAPAAKKKLTLRNCKVKFFYNHQIFKYVIPSI